MGPLSQQRGTFGPCPCSLTTTNSATDGRLCRTVQGYCQERIGGKIATGRAGEYEATCGESGSVTKAIGHSIRQDAGPVVLHPAMNDIAKLSCWGLIQQHYDQTHSLCLSVKHRICCF